MPIHKTITYPNGARIFIWNITEPESELRSDISLSPNSVNRLSMMSSDIHRRGFLSIRHLLATAGYSDHDLYYSEHGKPHLTDSNYISITHSFEFTAIIIAPFSVGIDIEKLRPKIIRISSKFIKYEKIDTQNEMEDLTKVWCAKESIYKQYAQPGLSFKRNIFVDLETPAQQDAASSTVIYSGNKSKYTIKYQDLPSFMCGYIWES